MALKGNFMWENLWWKPGQLLEILKSWHSLYFVWHHVSFTP